MAEENNKTVEEAVKKEEEKKDEVKKEEGGKEEERKKEEKEEKKETEIPDKFKNIVSEIEKMTVLELSELVKVLEERFGVSAQAVMAPVSGAGQVAGGGADKEEGGLKTVELKAAGDQKIQVIKVIKEILDLGLKDAKDFVDNAPNVVKEGLKPEEAEELKKKLEEAGATVEIK